ncbi:glycosyltransferase [Arcobacter sp.]|uniref:glycosyltransferase n=1 Tax=Arcobacter sp. TaxID=1872629 RepID=UPI003D0B5851
MNKVNIVLFSDTVYDLNGVSRFLNDFAEIKSDNKFTIITSTKKTAFSQKENIYNTKPYFKISMPFYSELDLVFPNPFKMAKRLKQLSPNLIHISTPGPVGLIGSFLAKIYKIPKAGIYHTDFPEYIFKNTNSKLCREISKRYLRFFYRNFDAIFVRSDEYKKIVINDLKIDKSKLFTLKAGIDTKKFSPSFRDKNIWCNYRIKTDTLKFLYVGRVTKEKNIKFLIELFKEISLLGKPIELIIVGNGEFLKYKEELKKYSINFLGVKQAEELSKIYASCDVFIFPSTTDTLGQVVLEAMCSGLPVIVTNEGGPKGFVTFSNSGIVLDIKDKKGWLDSIIKLYEDRNLQNIYSQNAKTFMLDNDIKNSYEDFFMKNSLLC